MNKNTKTLISQLFVFALTVVAAIVTNGQFRKINVWGFVVAYWAILTAKNAVEFVIGFTEHRKEK